MDRKTRELCCGTDGAVICGNQPTWQVKNETGGETRVCDLHLAWAMRKSGLPAIIGEHTEGSEKPPARGITRDLSTRERSLMLRIAPSLTTRPSEGLEVYQAISSLPETAQDEIIEAFANAVTTSDIELAISTLNQSRNRLVRDVGGILRWTYTMHRRQSRSAYLQSTNTESADT